MWTLTGVMVLLTLSSVVAAGDTGDPSYGALYQLGKEAYLEEDYQACVNLLLRALQNQREFEQLVVECRDRCHGEAAGQTLLTDTQSEPELAVFERLIRETRCLVQCHKQRLGAQLQLYLDSAWADDDFRARKPYEYLQLCYYKTGELQKAADAVFTVLLHSPDDQVMRENMQYYVKMSGVNQSDITSMEKQEHIDLYMRGNAAYEAGKFALVVRHMEDALDSYYEAEQRCRTLCQRFFRQGYNPDFVANVANHFAYVLRCKLRCPDQLSFVAGNHLPDYLASHFHYLQFAYYKQSMLLEACSNVESYLLFRPNDRDMLNNKQLYLKQEAVDNSWFTPRPEAVQIAKRIERETKLDEYILDKFRFIDTVKKKDISYQE